MSLVPEELIGYILVHIICFVMSRVPGELIVCILTMIKCLSDVMGYILMNMKYLGRLQVTMSHWATSLPYPGVDKHGAYLPGFPWAPQAH